jgi:hypothetical protein
MSALTAPAAEPRRARHGLRSLLMALLAWSGENHGIDPVYLGVLLVASFELWVQRIGGTAK